MRNVVVTIEYHGVKRPLPLLRTKGEHTEFVLHILRRSQVHGHKKCPTPELDIAFNISRYDLIPVAVVVIPWDWGGQGSGGCFSLWK